MPFSREASQPRDGTRVSYVSCTGGSFTARVTREAGAAPWTMYRGQKTGQLLRNVLTDSSSSPSDKEEKFLKKIPLKIEGRHCRVTQATSHSARGRGRTRQPAGFPQGLVFFGRGRRRVLIFPENKTFKINMFQKRTLRGFHP